MNKQEISNKRDAIIDLLNDDMYNTAQFKLDELMDKLNIGDVNEAERIHVSNNHYTY